MCTNLYAFLKASCVHVTVCRVAVSLDLSLVTPAHVASKLQYCHYVPRSTFFSLT